jgi:hypothetical protein
MNNLINREYFAEGLTVVPDIDEAENKLQTKWIPYFQEKFMLSVFGYHFYKELQSNYTDNTSVWYKIVNGSEYSVNDFVYRWDGLVNANKTSPLADYIFAKYRMQEQVTTESTNFTQNNAELATVINGGVKISEVLRRMDSEIQALYWFIYSWSGTEFVDFEYPFDPEKRFIYGESAHNYNSLGI